MGWERLRLRAIYITVGISAVVVMVAQVLVVEVEVVTDTVITETRIMTTVTGLGGSIRRRGIVVVHGRLLS